MEYKKLVRMFDQVKLSREREEAMLADLLCEKKEVSNMKQTNSRRRIPAAILAAAALAAMLAGTAVAVGYSERLHILPIAGDYENGYTIAGDVPNIPAEYLSEELLKRAAQTYNRIDELTFDSWSEAEEFLGLELANNPVLEEMARSAWGPLHEGDGTPEDMRRCTVLMSCIQGLPDVIQLHASYFGDYFEGGPFGVNVLASVRVKGSRQEDIPIDVHAGHVENVSEEAYVTPSGIEVTIFTQEGTAVRAVDGTSFQQFYYSAFFAHNNAVFQLYTDFSEETADTALNLLKQVLDAYE